MPAKWEKLLERWVAAGFIDAIAAQRIAAFEAQNQKNAGLRWPVLVAVSFGGVLLAAGVLLFVAAHWNELSPAWRFALLVLMLGGFHCVAAVVSPHFPELAKTLHAIGTIALGAGIFLAGQIFNLQEDWPLGLMLWALGAWLAWALLRDWVEATLAAILTPLWLAAEWLVFMDFARASQLVLAESLLILALTYLSARSDSLDTPPRRALAWLGGIALIPCVLAVLASGESPFWGLPGTPTTTALAIGWVLGIALPLALAFLLRRRAGRSNLLAALWVVALGAMAHNVRTPYVWHELGLYLWCIVGSVGLVGWGLLERRSERINLGVVGFALTVLVFYFSNVMDKIDRATSLIGLGVLFLAGGWMIERTRRRLLTRVSRGLA